MQVDLHYGCLVARPTPFTEVADFVTDTGYFDALAYSFWNDTFVDYYRVSYLFIYFIFSAWCEFFWEGLQCRGQFRMIQCHASFV